MTVKQAGSKTWMPEIQAKYIEIGRRVGSNEITKDQSIAEVEALIGKPINKLKTFELAMIQDRIWQGMLLSGGVTL